MDKLLKQVQEADFYVISFDEAMNTVFMEEQMDLQIRFWDREKQRVVTRFFTSEFLGHTTAKDIKKSFLQGISCLNLAKMLQVSMDGPKTNLKVLKLML